MPRTIDLVGRRFDRLLVIGRAENDTWSNPQYICLCDCFIIKVIAGGSLRRENTRSCGCYRTEVTKNRYLGKHRTEDTRKKLSISHIGINCGKDNGRWVLDRENLKTSDNSRARTSPKYDRWRDQVLARDYYICNDCFTQGLEVEAHHLFSFSEWEELRFDIDNGVTLCKEYHDKYKKKGFYIHRR